MPDRRREPTDADWDDSRSTTRDPFEHARGLFDKLRDYVDGQVEKLRDYVDERNKHRSADVKTLEKMLVQHEHDLMRGEKPGWVQTAFTQLHTDLEEMCKAMSAQAETLKWQNRMLVGTLVALCANLAALLVGVYR